MGRKGVLLVGAFLILCLLSHLSASATLVNWTWSFGIKLIVTNLESESPYPSGPTRVFGVHPDATDGYDEGSVEERIDIEWDAPPLPPSGEYYYFYFYHPDWADHKKLGREARSAISTSKTWKLRVEVSARYVGTSASLNWDPGDIPSHLGMTLVVGGSSVDMQGQSSYSFDLESATTDCDVVVQRTGANQAPVANAGTDQSVTVGESVTLDGSGSSDPDGDSLTYSWAFVSRPTGSSATLAGASTESPSFTPDVAGTYVIQLTVSDGELDDTDTVQVTASAPGANHAPVANAGTDQSVSVRDTVALDGSGSSDPDGDSLTYSWEFVSRPQGSSATLAGTSTESPSFTPDVAGTYVIQLTVSDGELDDTDTVQVTVFQPGTNRPPVADAGTDQSVSVGETVTLDGSESYDPDGDPFTTIWWFASRPTGSSATLLWADTARPSFVPDVASIYAIQLYVSDGEFSDMDTVQVRANASGTSEGTIRTTLTQNPVSSEAVIQFLLPSGADQPLLRVFDLLGQPIFQSNSSAGDQFRWSLVNDQGDEVPDGLYFYIITAEQEGRVIRSSIGRILVLR